MKKSFTFTSLLIALSIILSCSSDETSTPVTPPPPIVKYTISLAAGDGGTVSTTGGEYEAGQTVSVTATPQGEYLFKNWSDGNTDATRTITVNSNATLTANFEKKKYPLTVTIEGEGEVLEEIVNAGRTTDYDSGTTVKLTAVPAEGFEFIGWTGAIESAELEVQLLVSEAKEVTAEFKRSDFVSKSERYSAINETTGTFHGQNNFFRTITQQEAKSLEFGQVPTYRWHINDGVTYDFNKDGRLDLFGFLIQFEDLFNAGRYGAKPGKFFIIDDFFSGNRDMKLFETDFVWGGDFELNDLNNNGELEIILYSFNVHQNNLYGIDNPRKRVSVISIDENFNMSQREIGMELTVHDGASGDVDNDGDVDIIQWPAISHKDLAPNYQPMHEKFPKILLNDGSGNFIVKELFSDYLNLKEEYWDWFAETVELFDLNNDGYLDLISGTFIDGERRYPNFEHYNDIYRDIDVFWGDGSGVFNSNNLSKISVGSFNNLTKELIGIGFTDFDKDNDIDLVLTTTTIQPYYGTYIIYLIENLGNNSFSDVTELYIDSNSDLSETTFSNFYEVRSVDVDGDNDYDLVPSKTGSSWESWEVISTLYWEKQGVNFIKRENN